MPDLKPCPFCGFVPRGVMINSKCVGGVYCGGCDTSFKFYAVNSLKQVKDAWNRRAGEKEADHG